MDISVIIPVFRGEKTIEKLFEGIRENLKNTESFEVLFINDKSSDNSWEKLKILKNKYPNKIRIFNLSKNYGQHNAILFGISKAEGNLIITMDEDLQHDPKYLPSLIESQRAKECNVVYGRFKNPKHSLFRKVASRLLQKLLKFLIPGLIYYSSFRIIKKEVAQKLTLLKNSYTFIDASLINITSEIVFLDIDHRENNTRKSTYNIFKLAFHAFQIILAYTEITRWVLVSSFLFIAFGGLSILLGFTRREIQLQAILIGLALLIIGSFAVFIHKWKIKQNSLPITAFEYY